MAGGKSTRQLSSSPHHTPNVDSFGGFGWGWMGFQSFSVLIKIKQKRRFIWSFCQKNHWTILVVKGGVGSVVYDHLIGSIYRFYTRYMSPSMGLIHWRQCGKYPTCIEKNRCKSTHLVIQKFGNFQLKVQGPGKLTFAPLIHLKKTGSCKS